MPPKPTKIGRMTFKSMKEAESFIRKLRDRYEDDEPISLLDSIFLQGLLELHPEAEQKFGSGLQSFSVRRCDYGTRGFVIHRTDGTSTDFSFITCLRGADERRDRLNALRHAVDEQVYAFKRAAFEGKSVVPCAIRGTLTSFLDAHVDHVPPTTFRSLVDRWLLSSGFKLETLEISQPRDNQVSTELVNEQQLQSWREYHRQNARLRVVCSEANLSDAKRDTAIGGY